MNDLIHKNTERRPLELRSAETESPGTPVLSSEHYAEQVVLNFIQMKMASKHDQSHQKLSTLNLAYDYDKSFRRMVIDGMNYLGIDQHTTERVLEKNAQLWRQPTMVATFEKFYYPQAEQPENPVDLENWLRLKTEHQRLWLQCREYEYYREHQAIIDAMGTATPNMRLTPEQVRLLTEDLLRYEQLSQRLSAKLKSAQPTPMVNQSAHDRTL